MDGIFYLHNLAGTALQQANAEIAALRARVTELEQDRANAWNTPSGDNGTAEPSTPGPQ